MFFGPYRFTPAAALSGIAFGAIELADDHDQARHIALLARAHVDGVLTVPALQAAASLLAASQHESIPGLALLAPPALDTLLGLGLWEYSPGRRSLATTDGHGALFALALACGSRAAALLQQQIIHDRAERRRPLGDGDPGGHGGAEGDAAAGEANAEGEAAEGAEHAASDGGGETASGATAATPRTVPALEMLACQAAREGLAATCGSLLAGLGGLSAGFDSDVFSKLTYGLVAPRIEATEAEMQRLRP